MSQESIVVILVNFPPERAMDSVPVYDAIFTEKFDCIFIDDLGLKVEDGESRSTPEELGGVDADPKRWIAQSFGLDDVVVDQDSIERGFNEAFDVAISQVVTNCAPVRNIRPSSSKIYKEFYGGNQQKRTKMVRELLKEHPTWLSAAMDNLRNIWSNLERHDIIADICRNILTGKRTESLLDAVRADSHDIIYSTASPLVELIFSYGSYEQLHNMSDIQADRLFCLMVTVNSQRRKQKRDAAHEKIMLGEMEPKTPSKMILYHQISAKIEHHLHAILSTKNNREYAAVRQELETHIKNKDPNFWAAINIVDAHFSSKYKKEFVQRKMFRCGMQEISLDIITQAIDSISIMRDDHSVLKYHVAGFFFETELRFFYNAICPVQMFVPAVKHVPKTIKVPDITDTNNISDIKIYGLQIISHELWSRLSPIQRNVIYQYCNDAIILNVILSFFSQYD